MPLPQIIEDNLVDVGLVPNDGTGDDIREAFIKLNNNIKFLGENFGAVPSGANLGSSGESVFKEVVDYQYRFRKIDADGNLHVRLVGDVITLDFRPNTPVNFQGQNITNAGSVTASSFNGPLTGNVTGNVSGTASTVTAAAQPNITSLGTLTSLTVTNTINGSISGNAGTVTNGVYTTGNQTIDGFKTFVQPIQGTFSGNVTGNLTGLVKGTSNDNYININELENRINTFNFGDINPVFTDPTSYLMYVIGADMGTFNTPSNFSIDAGTL